MKEKIINYLQHNLIVERKARDMHFGYDFLINLYDNNQENYMGFIRAYEKESDIDEVSAYVEWMFGLNKKSMELEKLKSSFFERLKFLFLYEN